MNDNDNANMYEIFERLNRVQSMPSKIDEAAAKAAEKTRLDEKYMGFEKTVKAVAKNPKVKDPEAVAAAIGRKKYGKAKFQKAAAAGKKLGEDGMNESTCMECGMYEGNCGCDTNEGFMPAEEGNAFSGAVAQAKRDGVQPGEKISVGGKQYPLKEKLSAKGRKKFAALAPPKDKITFADKIAGAKQEVDEVLGNVAADAIKKAVGTHKGGQVTDEGMHFNNKKGCYVWDDDTGRVDKEDLTPQQLAKIKQWKAKNPGKRQGRVQPGETVPYGSQGIKRFEEGEVEEGFPTVADAEKRLRDKEGKTTKGKVTKTATGLRHTRDYEHDVGADDEKSSSGEKRKAGRPKKYTDDAPRQERVTAKSRKTDRTAHGQAGFKKSKVKENDVDVVDQGEYDQEGDMAKNDIKTIVRHAQALHKILGDNDNLPEWVQSKLAKIEAMMISVDEYMQNQSDEDGEEQELDEKAVSKKQQRFMGMVHAAQKGEKPASKEVAKVAKTMKKKDAEDFASTKHKGLPEKVKSKKKKEEESVEETTTAGSVATAPSSGKSSGGMSFGKGIYDSVDRKVEAIIAESMSINMSTSTEGGQTITVTASDDDAMKLAALLKMAGIGSSDADGGCESCGEEPCNCDHVDENAPDWPTNQEYNSDSLQYAGGLNRPKSSGQTTAPVFSRDPRRQHTPEDTELTRIKEIAGIKEAAKPDFLDMDKDGDKEEPMKKAVKDKEEEKKVEESIFALTNQWRAYKG